MWGAFNCEKRLPEDFEKGADCEGERDKTDDCRDHEEGCGGCVRDGNTHDDSLYRGMAFGVYVPRCVFVGNVRSPAVLVE